MLTLTTIKQRFVKWIPRNLWIPYTEDFKEFYEYEVKTLENIFVFVIYNCNVQVPSSSFQ